MCSIELNVAHLYTGLWAYFSSDNINRPAVAAWYKSEAAEEREHAEQLMEHLVRWGDRGGAGGCCAAAVSGRLKRLS